ncbi:MAG: aminotransferase class III-fold pyridoxal phosphate-dependent enzyme [Dehalococcoidia bacterium]
MTTSVEQLFDLKQSYEMVERLERVVPGGGIYFTRSPRFASYGEFPAFLRSADGSRITDVDGNSYIDFICAFGPIILGYNHPAVEAAANRQQAAGNALSFMPEVLVELAEKLAARWSPEETGAERFADWLIFAKNGSDVTTLATRVARLHTGRPVILAARDAYHGFDTWSVPGGAGIPEGHRSDIDFFEWNDVASLNEAFERNDGRVASAILCPIRHDSGHDIEMPSAEFVAAIHAALRSADALLIMDDIRAGFRLHPSGASHLALGFKPDLVCFGKALGNGHPISALTGRDELKETTSAVYFSGTHFCAATPMVAAVAVLDAYDDEQVFDRVTQAGERLRDGIAAAAHRFGVEISLSGPAAMPNMLFADDQGLKKMRRWAGHVARRGVILHPRHNWFLSSAHSDADIDEAVEVAERAFELVASGGE